MTPQGSNHAYRPSTEVELTTVMAACPDFADIARAMFGGYVRNWDDLHRAAGMLRPSCGTSEDAWNVAQRKLGLWSPLQLWRLSTTSMRKGRWPPRADTCVVLWQKPWTGSCASNGASMAECPRGGCETERMRSESRSCKYLLEPISVWDYIFVMTWPVLEHPDFVEEREVLPDEVCDKHDALILLLEQYGPQLGRPHVDTPAWLKPRQYEGDTHQRAGRLENCLRIRWETKRCRPRGRQQAGQEPKAILQGVDRNRR